MMTHFCARVLNANFRLGRETHAESLAEFATRTDMPSDMRVEALDMLGNWEEPSDRDRLLGMWRPLESRSREDATTALLRNFDVTLSGSNDVKVKAAQVASQLGLRAAGPALLSLATDTEQPAQVRADAIRGLARLRVAETAEALQLGLRDGDPNVRAAARSSLATLDPSAAVNPLRIALSAETTIERQEAAAPLATIDLQEASDALASALEQLIADEIPADTQLDILEAATARSSGRIAELLAVPSPPTYRRPAGRISPSIARR